MFAKLLLCVVFALINAEFAREFHSTANQLTFHYGLGILFGMLLMKVK